MKETKPSAVPPLPFVFFFRAFVAALTIYLIEATFISMYRYSVLFQEIHEPDFPKGWYYAHIPSLGLTTHGEGLAGAQQAAVDLLTLWCAEKQAHGEEIPQEATVFFSQIEIQDALQVR